MVHLGFNLGISGLNVGFAVLLNEHGLQLSKQTSKSVLIVYSLAYELLRHKKFIGAYLSFDN